MKVPLVCHVPSAVVTACFHEPKSPSFFSFISRLATSHKSSSIAFTTGYQCLIWMRSIHTQSILQCLAIHSMSAAGNNKCTHTDIIIAGRSMLILGKYIANFTLHPSHPKNTERPPPSRVLFTATGTKFPLVSQPLMESTNTPIWDRLGITIGLLRTAEQTGPTLSGCLLPSVPVSGSIYYDNGAQDLTTVSLSQLSDVGQYDVSLSPPPALPLAVEK